jgi:hypothetical protein
MRNACGGRRYKSEVERKAGALMTQIINALAFILL